MSKQSRANLKHIYKQTLSGSCIHQTTGKTTCIQTLDYLLQEVVYVGLHDWGIQRMAFFRKQKGSVLDKQAASRLLENEL